MKYFYGCLSGFSASIALNLFVLSTGARRIGSIFVGVAVVSFLAAIDKIVNPD